MPGRPCSKACDCAELSAQIILKESGAGQRPNQPSEDGESALLYLTDQDFNNGQFRAVFDINVYQGTRVFYRITEVGTEEGAGLLNLPNGEIRG